MPARAAFRTGDVTVHCLADGAGHFGPDVFPGVNATTFTAACDAGAAPGIATHYNAYALRFDDGAVWLVDTGRGPLFGAGAGQLPAHLAALGIAAGDVSRIVFTHLHGDHAGGALADGALVYPRAEVVMHADEAAFWAGKDSAGGRLLAAVSPTCVTDGEDLGRGLRAWALPGHTPGHMGLRIGADLVLTGDILHADALQLAAPATATRYDTDTARATQSRMGALAHIAESGLVWSGSHTAGAGQFARLARAGAGYRRLPL